MAESHVCFSALIRSCNLHCKELSSLLAVWRLCVSATFSPLTHQIQKLLLAKFIRLVATSVLLTGDNRLEPIRLVEQ